MKTLDSPYDFYKFTEEEQKALIGQCFTEAKRPDAAYYPVQLTEEGGWENYGREQGLIYFSSMRMNKDKTWFRVAAFSPDDLDMDLDFEGKDEQFREQVRDYLELYIATCPLQGVRYIDLLRDIQANFKAGEIT